MVFKESVGESIRLGDELVRIDGVPVDGKLASDCEAAVKKSTRLTAIPFGTGFSTQLFTPLATFLDFISRYHTGPLV